MDLIYTTSDGADIGVLTDCEYDLAYGEDENDFSCKVQRDMPLAMGGYLYIEGTEYGGVIDAVATDTAAKTLTYSGRSWHGVLNSHIIQPDSGQAYYTVSGDAHTIIAALITRLGIGGLFRCSGVSGITISSYSFDRYTPCYDGIAKMLKVVGAKLLMSYSGGTATLSVASVANYTDSLDADLMPFKATDNKGAINHLVCLGSGELQDRQVVHLYVDANGNISQTQTFTGIEEIADVYDYPNAESVADLTEKGTDRLEKLGTTASIEVDFKGDEEGYDIGDIIGATDTVSGVTVSARIVKKIVQLKEGRKTVAYEVE